MLDLASLLSAFDMIWANAFMVFVSMFFGIFMGVVLGALPGVSVTLAVALMLIPSMYFDPLIAVVFLSSVYTGAIYGGGISAVLLNIPGTPAAVATSFDGYPLTKAGRYNEALGYGLGSSLIGCLVAYLGMMFLIFPMGKFVLQFGPSELLMIVIFAISIIGIVRGGLIKSLIAGTFGLLLGTVGACPLGYARGTFGILELYDGIDFVAVLLGLYAMSEFLFLVDRDYIVEVGTKFSGNYKVVLKYCIKSFKQKINLIRSSLIGFIVGLLPAAGASIASMLSYGQAKNFSKKSENFGKGEPEGIVASEAANNASEAGAMATMLSFGIPGSGATAILMAALMMHGITPGIYLLRDHMDLTYVIILTSFLKVFFLAGIALVIISQFSRIVHIQTRLLIPVLAFTSILGIIAQRGRIIDFYILIIFGILGYVMRLLDYPMISLVLGVILGNMLDSNVLRVYRIFGSNPHGLLEQPIFLVLSVFTLLTIIFFSIIPNIKLFLNNRKERSLT